MLLGAGRVSRSLHIMSCYPRYLQIAQLLIHAVHQNHQPDIELGLLVLYDIT